MPKDHHNLLIKVAKILRDTVVGVSTENRRELAKLITLIEDNPANEYLISRSDAPPN